MTYIILLLYAILVFLTIKTKQTYTPAGVMVFLWTALNGVLLLFFRDWVIIKYPGFFYTVIGVGVFLGGAIVGQKTAKPITEKYLLRVTRNLITPTLAILIILGFIWPIYYIYTYGFSLSNLFNLDELGEMNKEFSTERYYSTEEIIGYSKLSQSLLIFTYVVPIIGGFCWLITKQIISKILCLITVLPCIMITASQSTKMAMIISIIFWLSGWLVCSITYYIRLNITIKTIVIGISVFALFMTTMFYSMLTRWGNNYDNYKIEQNKTKLFDYTFGSFLSFDYWFYDNIHNIDYSTTILQNSKLRRLGYFHNVDNGIKIDFPEIIHAPYFEIYGRHLYDCEYQAGRNYTISFDVTSNVKPDSVKYSLVSFSTLPQVHYPIKMDSCKQIGLQSWHYIHTFKLDSNRFKVLTPDIILSFDSVKFVEITKFRIDTGAVAQPWEINSNNIFWHKENLQYGAMTFMGIANALGLADRKLGLYRDLVYFGRLNKTSRSNVYTIFRLLIDDFGIIGALAFLFILGFISSKAVAFINQRKWLFLSQVVLVAIYSLIMWSFATSIWAYTSILCAYGLAFIIFSILQKPLHGDTWVTKITKILKPKQK